ncbi:hypothetical protein AAFF_G00419660 [Aldrovandia affinis]|uniref:Uncharacterized protein n=1 Tax=Aldrovandia affinis TaxID=143900 RepID=A0AAD7SA64_9TELE|nr:hypothetical protein AAFF_G00419660 [Aldrovandia affinis]
MEYEGLNGEGPRFGVQKHTGPLFGEGFGAQVAGGCQASGRLLMHRALRRGEAHSGLPQVLKTWEGMHVRTRTHGRGPPISPPAGPES